MLILELPCAPEDVEAPVETLPATPVALWRMWGWAVALVVTAGLFILQQFGPHTVSGSPVLGLASVFALTAFMVLALARYQVDRRAVKVRRDTPTFLATNVAATGTTVRRSPQGPPLLTYTDASGHVRTARYDNPRLAPPDGRPIAVWYSDSCDLLLARFNPAWATDVEQARLSDPPR